MNLLVLSYVFMHSSLLSVHNYKIKMPIISEEL